MKLMIFNGLLLFMLFVWTSAKLEPGSKTTRELQHHEDEHENRFEIQGRRKACRDLGGKCIKKKRDCPSNRPLKTPPGKPFCSKRRHCCYPEPPSPTTLEPLVPGPTEPPSPTTLEPLVPGPTEQTVPEITEILFSEDSNNVFDKITIKLNDKKLLHGDSSIFNGPTISALRKLQVDGEFHPRTNVVEHFTTNHTKLQNDFLDKIMDTRVMNTTKNFLTKKGHIKEGFFRSVLEKIWFTLFSRPASIKRLGSSGFEHVFRGEINSKSSKATGFHNWVYYFHEQDNPDGNPQLTYIKPAKEFALGDKGKILEIKFQWLNKTKEASSMFIGTSPELEMAVYTICFFAHPNTPCEVKMAGTDFTINTSQYTDNTDLVSTAFPMIPKIPPK